MCTRGLKKYNQATTDGQSVPKSPKTTFQNGTKIQMGNLRTKDQSGLKQFIRKGKVLLVTSLAVHTLAHNLY